MTGQQEKVRYPESREVVEQRMAHLTSYVKDNLPELFSEEEVKNVKGSVLMQLLKELDEDMNPGEQSLRIYAYMSNQIAMLVDPHIEYTSTQIIAKRYIDNEDDEEEFEIEVDWQTLEVQFQGPLESPAIVANQVVAGILNSRLWNDINYLNISIRTLQSVGNMIDCFYGLVALMMISTYIRVVEMGQMPAVECLFNTY